MVNRVTIVGRLGADPEVRSTQSGTTVTNMRVATNRHWKDNDGKSQEETEWHRIVVFGKQAEACGEYLEKGRQVYLEGRLQTNEWEDRDGNNRYTTEVVAQNVQFLSGGGGAPEEDPPSSRGGNPYEENDESDDEYDQTFDDDDIPF